MHGAAWRPIRRQETALFTCSNWRKSWRAFGEWLCGACRKRVTELDTKLKVALQEKATAVSEKANLERQLKQHRSQTQSLQTTLEKKDQVETKKRESILVVSVAQPCRRSCD